MLYACWSLRLLMARTYFLSIGCIVAVNQKAPRANYFPRYFVWSASQLTALSDGHLANHTTTCHGASVRSTVCQSISEVVRQEMLDTRYWSDLLYSCEWGHFNAQDPEQTRAGGRRQKIVCITIATTMKIAHLIPRL